MIQNRIITAQNSLNKVTINKDFQLKISQVCSELEVEGITVGARCQVMPGARRGVVMFIGAIDQLKPGHWVSELALNTMILNYS